MSDLSQVFILCYVFAIHVADRLPADSVFNMPAPVTLSPTAPTSSKVNGSKTKAPLRNKKTRIVRRRGRARGGIDSDDEIEREAGTDSESDDDDQSSIDSDSDSDTEPASEDVLPNGHARILTQSLEKGSGDVVQVSSAQSKSEAAAPTAFFGGAAGDWSEMVTDENANGPADLPVIDFAELDKQSQSRKGQKGTRKPPLVRKASIPALAPSTNELNEASDDPEEPIASTSRQPSTSFPRRAQGQTARQAYQQRLDKDPSYVPTVGEFWGHDDRLLDKDLRSLSGWWRGRWQGRGRGRGGFDRGFRGRGRGGFFGPPPGARPPNDEAAAEEEAEETKPPIERAWGHDGFEEMKKKEEARRTGPQPFRGAATGLRGGRGAFMPGARGRGGMVTRGGLTSSPAPSNHSLPPSAMPGRTWYAMKPERVWTKQHDGFLYFDPALKPRPGLGQGIQVKFPGKQGQFVRAPPASLVSSTTSAPAKVVDSTTVGNDDGEKIFVVSLPKRSGKEREWVQPQAQAMESFTTVEEPPVEEPFTVRQRPVTRPSIPDHPTEATVPALPPAPQERAPIATQPDPPAQPNIVPDDQGWIQLEPSALLLSEPRVDTAQMSPMGDDRLPPPVLPPIQTSFTPPAPQTSPPYGSPYGYQPGLPPGVGMNQQGMPYELSTGRAVYFQPPQHVYNPRPVMHTHMPPPFVPGHMRHQSTAASPDFLAPPSHTPPVNGFIDPSTGTPIFSMPRQSSRVEIRAPSDQADSKYSQKTVRRPSGLRTTAATFEPQLSAGPDQAYFPHVSEQPNGHYNGEVEDTQQQGMDPAMMGYSPYQQQYYYPQEHYGYPPYQDMSQMPQYDMYAPDPHAPPQQAVYY